MAPCSLLAAAQKVDFYGVVSPDAEQNMVRMTEDVYFAQLGELAVALTDCRNATFAADFLATGTPDFSASSGDTVAFFAEIRKLDGADGKWECVFHFANIAEATNFDFPKEYDSYYKILMESKASLKAAVLSALSGGGPPPADAAQNMPPPAKIASTEEISGTWSGDPSMDKVIIMRSGRGFVVFKNGASMNISVSIAQDDAGATVVRVRQTGTSNASFFPELPRKTALEAATSAVPMEWSLTLTAGGSLKGFKRTMVLDEGTDAPVEASIPTEWTRR
ncbi:MAG: hypothetical protein K2H09_02570 [Treponemataceae bacterium]|nr:hypothetical protein [Treponemataceae bacterium]